MDDTKRTPEGEEEPDPQAQEGAAERESEQPGDEAEPDDPVAAGKERAGETLERLRGGSAVSLGSTEVPLRSLVAIGIFIVVFMVAWMALWFLLGGFGLGLGWLGAAAIGALAVKVYADRAGTRARSG